MVLLLHLFYVQFFFHVVQVNSENAADTLILHGDAVEHISLFHGTTAVGDADKLGVIGQIAHIVGKADNIGIIQRGFDLVHHDKGCGAHLQNGEVQ